MLAAHPGTAKFIATKLCRRFIADNPTQTIVDQVADVLHVNWNQPNQIKLAMEVLLKSQEFLNTWGEKVKRPLAILVDTLSAGLHPMVIQIPNHTGWVHLHKC